MMRVMVVGAGAMGCLFGARFAAAGAPVRLLDVDAAHVAAIRSRGLRLVELNGDEKTVRLDAVCEPAVWDAPADVVLVMVKSYATKQALRLVHPESIAPHTVFLSLQNGMGNGEILAELVGAHRVLIGVTAQGATKVAPGVVRHGGVGPTSFGSLSGNETGGVSSLLQLFAAAGLEASYRHDIRNLLWQKLCINVGINAVTALCGIDNGLVAALDPARKLCEAAVMEAVAVARAEGAVLPDDMVDRVLAVAQATASNRSSMRQDVENYRPTEIDAINGVVVRYARRHGLTAPVNWTLTQLVKIRELTYGDGKHKADPNA